LEEEPKKLLELDEERTKAVEAEEAKKLINRFKNGSNM
jgi:hypothetical protein